MLIKIQVFSQKKLLLVKIKKNLIFLRQFINNKKNLKNYSSVVIARLVELDLKNFLKSLELVTLYLITLIILMTIFSA